MAHSKGDRRKRSCPSARSFSDTSTFYNSRSDESNSSSTDRQEKKSLSRWKMLHLVARTFLALNCATIVCLSTYCAFLSFNVVLKYKGVFDDTDPFAASSFWKQLIPTFSTDTIVCLTVAILSIFVCMCNVNGLVSAISMSMDYFKCYLYSIIFIFFLSLATLITCFTVSSTSFMGTAYEIALRRLYSDDWVYSPWSVVIDETHKRNYCCAYDVTKHADANSTSTYLILLYWIEATDWGARKAESIGYNNSQKVELVPRSCCKQQTPDCNKDLYGARLSWDEQKEQLWSDRIYNVSCLEKVPKLEKSAFVSSSYFITIFGSFFGLLLLNILCACFLMRKAR